MISFGIDFHNVSELVLDPLTHAYQMLRFPGALEPGISEQGQRMNRSSTGVELRFVMLEEEVEVILRGHEEPGRAYLYFGSIQGEWHQSSFVILANQNTSIRIKRPLQRDALRRMNQKRGSIYPFDLVRIVLDGSRVDFVGINGKVEAPKLNLPTYLSYGSSITSNSIVFVPELSFTGRLSQDLKMDHLNLGSSGSCEILPHISDYLSTIPFDFATFELGVNIISEVSVEEYHARVAYLLQKVALSHMSSPIVVTDIFSYFNRLSGVTDAKVSAYRKALRDSCRPFPNVCYVPGNALLHEREFLCADFVHPDLKGHEIIYNRLKRIALRFCRERKEEVR